MAVDPDSRAAHRLLCGRLAGALFLLGSLASIPVNQLLHPAVDDRVHAITAVAAVSGALCLLVRWDRLRAAALGIVPFVASLEVALTMWGVGVHAHAHLWFLVFIVVFAAFAFDERRVVAVQVAVAVAVAGWPLTFLEGHERQNFLGEMAVAVPILLTAAVIVVHLRERLTAAVEALAGQALTDPLTGIANRRLLDMRLDYEIRRHRRSGRPLSVLVMDLDGFKQVNDTLGHPAGDELLRQVARALCATVREQDTPVRQGGDEFVVVAPETDAVDAAALVGRIKLALHAIVAGGHPLSVSVGAATFPADATSAEVLLAEADVRQRVDKAAARERRGMLSLVRL